MDPVTQQSLTIIFGTLAPILVVGGGALAWLRSDIQRAERKSEGDHQDIRGELKDMRGELKEIHGEIGGLKQSQVQMQVDIAKIQVEVRCLNDKFDIIEKRMDKISD